MADSNEKQSFRAGELARAAGVSTDTLRHYERKGVLASPRRSSNGYREYPAEALQRVRLVRRALSVGFTLDELAQILRVRDQGGAPCREARALAAAKLSAVETQLGEMTSLRDELRAMLEDWDRRLRRTTTGVRAALLESLAAESSRHTADSVLAPAWRRKRERKEYR